jgi:hypothetical protein
MIGIHKGDAPDFRPTENVYTKPDLRGRNINAAPRKQKWWCLVVMFVEKRGDRLSK